MPTKYATNPETWNSALDSAEQTEKPCPVCRGYVDKVDACITCEGNGTVLV